MSKREIFRNGCLIPLGLLVVMIWALTYYFTTHSWKGAFPADLDIGKKLISETPIIAPPGGSCGGAVFWLKNSSSKEIQENRIDYFTSLNTSRSWDADIVWYKLGDGSDWALQRSFHCLKSGTKKGKKFKASINRALNSGNGYYGVLGGKASATRLLIIPSENIAVVGYWD